MQDLYGQIKDNTEKLTAAVYRVTDLMSDKEPIKWTLRDKSIYVLNNIMSIKKEPSVYSVAIESISDMTSFLSLFSMGIYVSKMNFEILAREYKKIKDILEGQKDTLISDKLYLPADINFQISESSPKENVFYLNKNETFQIKKEDRKEMDLENKVAEIKMTRTVNNSSSAKGTSTNGADRKNKLLSILKENGSKTAGELSIYAPEVSGKTIQRDLVDLVGNGLVSAEGEKRWRKYSLNVVEGNNSIDTLTSV